MTESPLVSIIERIMTQHWDLAACRCWVCVEGRAAGCRPRERYASWNHPEEKREPVRVRVYPEHPMVPETM